MSISAYIKRMNSEFIYLKWYMKLCILLPFVRAIHPTSWDRLVISWPDYTYYELWYFFISRLLEATLFYSLSKITEYPLLFLLALMGYGKVWDEVYTPFNYRIGELLWCLTVILITYIQWSKSRRNSSYGSASGGPS